MATSPSAWVRTLRFLAFLFVALALVSLGAQRWEYLTGTTLASLVFFALLGLERLHAPLPSVPDVSTPAVPRSPAIKLTPDPVPELAVPRPSMVAEGYADHQEDEEEDLDDPMSKTDQLFLALSEGGPTDDLVQTIARLVAEGADLSETDEDGDNALEAAALRRLDLQVLQALVDAGARVSADTEVLSRVLSEDPSVEEVKLLLANGASVDDPSSDYGSLIEQALREDVEDRVVIALLEAGPAFVTDSDDRDWAFVSIDSDRSTTVLEAILDSASSTGQPIDKTAALLLAFSKDDLGSMAVILATGTSPFEIDEVDDASLVRMALENDDANAVFLLALACVGSDRYRLLGWVEASSDFTNLEAFQRWNQVLSLLEQKWKDGYGDPLQPTVYAEGTAGAALNESLLNTTDPVQVQQLLLAGANPFWSPGSGKPSAFEQACRRRDGSFVAMLLESESDQEADFRLGTLENSPADLISRARAELALRRFARTKVLEATA